jgi:hypothetical protein
VIDEVHRSAHLATAAATIAVVSGISGIAHIITGGLFVCLLALMTIDMGYLFLTHTPPPPHPDWRAAIKGKYLELMMVVTSFVMDATIYLIASYLPKEFALLEQGLPVVTITTMLWFIAAEIFEIVGRYSLSPRVASAPPHLLFVAELLKKAFRSIRKVDSARWKARYGEAAVLPERWPEAFTESELAEIMEKVEGMRPRDVPPNPEELLEKNEV